MRIGLVDGDLLSSGTRFPNLTLLKIAGYLRDNGFVSGENYVLITEKHIEQLFEFDRFYVSCVFSFTYEKPSKSLSLLLNTPELKAKTSIGGTGSYANLTNEEGFGERRYQDIHALEHDAFLNTLKKKDGTFGIDIARQMPDYTLYDEFIKEEESTNTKKKKTYFKDYKYYSIGFLTRGCFRRCPFCVNKNERKAVPYSNLSDFLCNDIDETTGRLKRPYIYLWDDNFLACPQWETMLQQLIDSGRPFQFRQGLDERLLAQHKNGEKMAQMLAKAKYHGDYIFAFDNWMDRKIVTKALDIWRKYAPSKNTKFYLFCGFQQDPNDLYKFQKDIAEIFLRISVLMKYKALPYIMRHEDFKKAPLSNIYTQIARWCNQPAFFRNMSFWEFCYKNQAYYEKTKGMTPQEMKTFDEFMTDYSNGEYDKIGLSLPIKTFIGFLNMFHHHKALFIKLFTLKMEK